MINIQYRRENNQTIVSVDRLPLDETIYPLKFVFKNIVSNEIHYETNLSPDMWASWIGAELITDVLVYTSQGDLIRRWNWDVMENGDSIEKYLWCYLKNQINKGENPNGLVIGSHDGRNGHWIYPIAKGMGYATLVDGSENQYLKLLQNYSRHKNVKTMNTIVTVDGSDVTWYQGGEGYTDTVKKELIEEWLDQNQISSVSKKSISINELMSKENYDWLHLDVEGIDADLILSLQKKPNLIIYESMNLSFEEKLKLSQWFSANGYSTTVSLGNTLAIKNKITS